MHLYSKLSLALLLILSSSLSAAKTTDQEQPINIEADSVEIREREGISTYRGHVKIIKGSMLIKGDLIYIHTGEKGLEKILVEGKPATFKHLNDQDEEITAQSHKMTYQASSGILVLKKDAVLEQSNNRFTSEHIVYDTQKDIVQAGSDEQTTDQQPGRVSITIQPQKDNNQDNEKTTP